MAQRTLPDPLAIDAGALRHAVTVQAQATAPDVDTGQTGTTWSNVLSAMAAVDTWSEREASQGGQFVSQVIHKVTLRWPGASVGIEAGMRVVFGARCFTIQAVENVQERNRVLKLMCIEIDGGQ